MSLTQTFMLLTLLLIATYSLLHSKNHNPNVFRYDETMNDKHRSKWIKSAIKEIADLEQFDYLVEVRIE
jgi:hypothetical protein